MSNVEDNKSSHDQVSCSFNLLDCMMVKCGLDRLRALYSSATNELIIC